VKAWVRLRLRQGEGAGAGAAVSACGFGMLVVVDVGAVGGQSPTRALVDIGIAPKDPPGGYLITVYMVSFPQQLAAQNQATVTAIFHSYKTNTAVQLAEIHADAQATQAFTQSRVAATERCPTILPMH
jgi:hypothetical protein